jgi:hypothetical protein
MRPNVAAEWLAFLLHIRDNLGSNLGPETGYSDRGFSWFFSIPPDKFRDSSSRDRFLHYLFQFIIY